MKLILFICLLFLNLTAFGYTPTLDSLLRNGGNVDIANNTVVANLKIKYTPAQESVQAANPIIQNEALKFLIYNEREDLPKMVQLQYAGGKISKETLHDIKVIPFHSLNAISRNKENIEQRLFYSILGVLLKNDGNLMLEFLAEQGVNIPGNKDLVNKDKERLLKDYRFYLKKIKENSTVAEIKNPLKPADEEDRKKVDEIMQKPFLAPDGFVKRFKNGDYFNWIVESDQLFISFDYDHKLEEILLKTSEGPIKVTFGRFLLQSANFEFPELVTITDAQNNKYEITLTKISMFPDNSNTYFKRLKRYQEFIEANKISELTEKLKIIL